MLKGKGILTDIQKTFLKQFAKLPDQDSFCLSGGTALAEYYLGHRLSYDLDLFTTQPDLIIPFSYQVEKLEERSDLLITVVRRFASFVEFQINLGGYQLKVDLALDSPFRLAPVEQSDMGFMVSDFVDLQADKVLAFFGRAEPRDAIDLHFLLKMTSFDELAEIARQKDPGFDLYWFAVALNRAVDYPDEIERWPVKMLVECDPIALKYEFQALAGQIMDGLIQP
jgi:hypothetical protein